MLMVVVYQKADLQKNNMRQDKLIYVTEKWKAYYKLNCPKSEISKRIAYLESNEKQDLNTLAKIKALKSLK